MRVLDLKYAQSLAVHTSVLVVFAILLAWTASVLLSNLGSIAMKNGVMNSPAIAERPLFGMRTLPALSAESFGSAERMLSLATRVNPFNPTAWKDLGLVDLLRGDTAAADRALDHVAPASGQWQTARFLAGYSAEMAGDHARAIATWREADAAPLFADRAVYWYLYEPRYRDRAVPDALLAIQIDGRADGVAEQLASYLQAGLSANDSKVSSLMAANSRYLQAIGKAN